jgi:hypothetical protein
VSRLLHPQLLRIVRDRLRYVHTRLDLVGHFLKTRCQGFDSPLLLRKFQFKIFRQLRDRCFLLLNFALLRLDFAMLFEELVEQSSVQQKTVESFCS